MSKTQLIVAIDGPSGAGKSTLSKALARALGYVNIDTGAMYRSVALMAQRHETDIENEESLIQLCDSLTISFQRDNGDERVFVNGTDISADIRTPEVSLLTAQVASKKVVRQAMVEQQRTMGANGGVVLEGRDIGSVVFPAAEVKFFLSASAEERGRRRFEELQAKGMDVSLKQTIAEVEERDRVDSEREHAPLIQADDAVLIDSTKLSIEQVLDEMVRYVKCRENGQ